MNIYDIFAEELAKAIEEKRAAEWAREQAEKVAIDRMIQAAEKEGVTIPLDNAFCHDGNAGVWIYANESNYTPTYKVMYWKGQWSSRIDGSMMTFELLHRKAGTSYGGARRIAAELTPKL